MSLLRKTLKVQEGKYVHKFAVGLKVDEDRIWFQQTPFSKVLNRAIKTFSGYKWHGHLDPPIKKWSIANCHRNVFQLQYLWGEDVYAYWKRPMENVLTEADFTRPEFAKYGATINGAQVDMVNRGLNYHFQILAAEQGLGKSLAAMEIMERSGKKEWWYVGPKSALASVQRDCEKWGLDPSIKMRWMSYQALIKEMRYNFDGLIAPDGIILDECTAAKTPSTHTAIACQAIADLIREQHGFEGYVLLLSGTPSAKRPSDMWSQCEVAWPGYLREGSERAFEMRYAIMEEYTDLDGVTFNRKVGWNMEEVARLPNRYKGLMTVYRKADWLNLPEKKYITVNLEPSPKVLRVAKSLCAVAPNAITALTWTRALSSGFQYVNTRIGDEECTLCGGTGKYHCPSEVQEITCPNCAGVGHTPDYERQTRKVKTPKDGALRNLLDQVEAHGRVVIAASFQGSIDRILGICKARGWAVACVDGRGWRCYDNQGKVVIKGSKGKDSKKLLLDFWDNHDGKVAFVCNPGSARYGLTLTLAWMLVFYDNDFSAEHRLQMEDRIHRMSMDLELGATIVDLIHLPVDQKVADTLKSNKEVEAVAMGIVNEITDEDEEEWDGEVAGIEEELLEEIA